MTSTPFEIKRKRRYVRASVKARIGILGKSDGTLYCDERGKLWARWIGSVDVNGNADSGTPFKVWAGETNYLPQAGRQVYIGPGRDGRLTVLGAVPEDLANSELDQRLLNPNDPYRTFDYPANNVLFRSDSLADAGNDTFKANLNQLLYLDAYGTWKLWNGTDADTHIDVEALKPMAADEQCLAIVALRTLENDYQTAASTPISAFDDLSVADVQEAAGQLDAECIHSRVYRLYYEQTTLIASPVTDWDLRQWINVPARLGNPNVITHKERVRENHQLLYHGELGITTGDLEVLGEVGVIDDTASTAVSGSGITQLIGDVTAGPGSGTQAATIANNAVSTAMIQDNAVTADKIAMNAVGSSELANGAVDTLAIQDDAVTQDKIADNAVGLSQLANASVDTDAVLDSAITTEKLNDGAVTTEKLADEAVTTAKIDAGAVTYLKLSEDATPMVCDYRVSGINTSDSLADTPGGGTVTLYLIKFGGGDKITLHDGRWYMISPSNGSTPQFVLEPSGFTVSYTNGSNVMTTSSAISPDNVLVGGRCIGVTEWSVSPPVITAITGSNTFTCTGTATANNSGVSPGIKSPLNANIDLFAYLTGSSTEIAIAGRTWTNNTTRAVALAQTNGRWHMTGAEEYLYLSSIYTDGSGNVHDTVLLRKIWNYYNRQIRDLYLLSGLNSFNDTNTSMHQYNSSTVQQVEVMIGMANLSRANLTVHAYGSVAGMRAGVGYDSTTTFDSGLNLGTRSAAAAFSTDWRKLMPDIGNHVLSMNAVGAAVGSWFGQNNSFEAGMSGAIWM